jgi:hypothetical protein
MKNGSWLDRAEMLVAEQPSAGLNIPSYKMSLVFAVSPPALGLDIQSR